MRRLIKKLNAGPEFMLRAEILAEFRGLNGPLRRLPADRALDDEYDMDMDQGSVTVGGRGNRVILLGDGNENPDVLEDQYTDGYDREFNDKIPSFRELMNRDPHLATLDIFQPGGMAAHMLPPAYVAQVKLAYEKANPPDGEATTADAATEHDHDIEHDHDTEHDYNNEHDDKNVQTAAKDGKTAASGTTNASASQLPVDEQQGPSESAK